MRLMIVHPTAGLPEGALVDIDESRLVGRAGFTLTVDQVLTIIGQPDRVQELPTPRKARDQ